MVATGHFIQQRVEMMQKVEVRLTDNQIESNPNVRRTCLGMTLTVPVADIGIHTTTDISS